MGILDTILAPIKDVISGLEKPVKVVEKVFGEVIDITEETIKLIEGMIKDIEDLANAQEIEGIFLAPFKEAGMETVGTIEKIYGLIKDARPTADGYEDLILTPLKDAYSSIRTSTKNLLDEGKNILNNIKTDETELISAVKNHFETMSLVLNSYPQELTSLKTTIKRNFEIREEKLFNVVPEFSPESRNTETILEQKVTDNSQINVESFKSVEKSLKDRLSNENDVLDFFIVFMIVLILGFIVSVYFFTKSTDVIKSFAFIFIFGFLFYFIARNII